MKKARLLIFAFALVLALSAGLLSGCTELVDGGKYGNDVQKKLSKGLEYEIFDGNYAVIGIGTCTDTDINIPATYNDKPVTSIGVEAFRGCSDLTSVTIPDSVTSIGSVAFRDCTGLTSITIPNSVTHIGDSAFSGCTGLTSITIPDSVTSIGVAAFSGCRGLTSITVSDKNTTYHSAGNCIIETATKTLIAGCNNSVIPCDGSVTSIGGWAFSGRTGLTSITIPDSVTSIGGGAFYECTSLTLITFNGTKAQWEAVNRGYNWNYNTGNYTIHCTDGDIAA